MGFCMAGVKASNRTGFFRTVSVNSGAASFAGCQRLAGGVVCRAARPVFVRMYLRPSCGLRREGRCEKGPLRDAGIFGRDTMFFEGGLRIARPGFTPGIERGSAFHAGLNLDQRGRSFDFRPLDASFESECGSRDFDPSRALRRVFS